MTTTIPLDADRWGWGDVRPTLGEHLGRRAARFPDGFGLAVVDGIELAGGTLELDIAVTAERSFPGVGWHVTDPGNYESFFVRPHQVGNPDAIQYTPVTNGISCWQLYHGPGYWAPIAFPLDAWFTIRVAFAGGRATIHVGDLVTPALVIDELKLNAPSGGIGLLVGGPGLHLARFAWSGGTPRLPGPKSSAPSPQPGTVLAWDVSEPFAEGTLDSQLSQEHRWTSLATEPSGLANLGRVHGIDADRNTVLARVILESDRHRLVPLDIGFSDRAVVHLNGQPLWRGDDTYRSRDYRFLGSIGYWDRIYLPLHTGSNELVAAVSETFGGWGIQARLPDPVGIVIRA